MFIWTVVSYNYEEYKTMLHSLARGVWNVCEGLRVWNSWMYTTPSLSRH